MPWWASQLDFSDFLHFDTLWYTVSLLLLTVTLFYYWLLALLIVSFFITCSYKPEKNVFFLLNCPESHSYITFTVCKIHQNWMCLGVRKPVYKVLETRLETNKLVQIESWNFWLLNLEVHRTTSQRCWTDCGNTQTDLNLYCLHIYWPHKEKMYFLQFATY